MLATFSQMGVVKMKTPAETRSKVIEIDRMAKLTAEITGEPPEKDTGNRCSWVC